jgi:hypothetical protein
MTAYQRILEALRAQGKLVKPLGPSRAQAQCPAHEDHGPSLAITQIEGQALIYCHARCRTEDVLTAIGLTLADLFDNPKGATYRYDDGRTVHRTPDKQFPQWGNKNGQRSTLYHLSRIEEARVKGEPVLLVEGEKDVHAIESLGAYATCAPMGAASFHKVDPSPLYGLEVMAIVDNDEAGEEEWAPSVLAALDGKAALNFAKGKIDTEHADIADHIAAGYSLAELVPWVPPERDGADQGDEEWIAEQGAAFQFALDVEREARWLRVRDLARQKIIQESAVGITLPEFIRLDDFLAQPDSATPYLVDQTWPKGGHILLAAQQKLGKPQPATTSSNP